MPFTEESLEHAVLELFAAVEIPHTRGEAVRKEVSEVLLVDDLKQFLLQNYAHHDITPGEIQSIIRELQVLPSSALYESNLAFIRKLADGFPLKREDKDKKDLFIYLIDFEKPENNQFKIVNQLEIQGTEKRIPDALVYINGLPLVVWEFKSAVKENTTLRDAYTQLTVRYRRDIPELLKYNAFCVISDGANNKMGSLFAPYDFFYAWRKINPEDAPKDGISSLHTLIHGIFEKSRFVELVRNYIYFPDTSKEDVKIVCRYPQFYAAQKLFTSILENRKPAGSGKGGTYFGATGCGKSYTMLYLTRLLMKSREMNSPTIVLITDRTDLDDQLSAQFTNAKKFIGDEVVETVESRDDLKAKLQGRKSGGVFLTTIHKFTEAADLLTDRTNVVCISDEAHRSQVNLDQKIRITDKGVERKFGFARHLHNSLPNATYVGFTGTPIDATLDVFGEVVDAYTMKESVQDEITVRIVYEGRAAKVLLNEEKLREIEEYYKKCALDGANENQIEESKRAMLQMEVILGDPKRLKLLAEDFVTHYEERVKEKATVKGKVMLVVSSRPIAWALYQEIIALRPEWAEIRACEEGAELTEAEKQEVKPIEKIKMVMTRHKDDVPKLYYMLGTKESRKELDRQFKEARSNFKIAIVVDMWLTGFDVPFLDTIYIDKPIQLHSLIQTISRVNRVYEGKDMGLVVDYIGIKSNMNLALAKYSKTAENDFEDIGKAITLVKDQLDLLNRLFHGFDSRPFFVGQPLEQLDCLNRATEFVQQTEEREKRFSGLVKKLRSAYNLCCGSEEISPAEKDRIHFYFAIKAILHKLTKGDAPDSSQMNDRVRELIAEALISEGIEEIFKLDKEDASQNVDIFSDAYMEKIEKIKLPNTKIKLLQKLLNKAIADFKKVNLLKGIDFSEKLKKLVATYNERKDFQVLQSDVLNDVAESFANLFNELKTERNSFLELGIGFEEKAFYDILKAISEKYKFEYPEEKLLKLCQEVKAIVDDKARYTDWANREDIKAELKVDLILVLAENGYPPVPQDEVFKEIFKQAEGFKKHS